MPNIGDTFTILASLGGVNGTFLNTPITSLGAAAISLERDLQPA